MKINIVVALVLGIRESQGRFLQSRADETLPLEATVEVQTPMPLPDNFKLCWSHVPISRRVRILPQTDIAFLVLWGIRALAMEPFNDRLFLPSFKSSKAPNLEIPIYSYSGRRQVSIETQMYGMWWCWVNMLRDFKYMVDTVICNFGGQGPIDSSEGKLTYINHAFDSKNGENDITLEKDITPLVDVDQSRNQCSESQISRATSRRNLNALAIVKPVKRASSPSPIDYSAWEKLSANDTDIEEGSNNESNREPEYYALIGDFSGDLLKPLGPLQSMVLVLMHLAKTTSPEARTQSMPEQRIQFLAHNFVIDYHPRPGAVEPPSYEAVIKGIAWIARLWKITDQYQGCTFVLFHRNNPVVDGKIQIVLTSDNQKRD